MSCSPEAHLCRNSKFFQTYSAEICSKAGQKDRELYPTDLCSEEGFFALFAYLLFKDSRDLGKIIVQVDACETLFKKPGMKYVRKWEDRNVNVVQVT